MKILLMITIFVVFISFVLCQASILPPPTDRSQNGQRMFNFPDISNLSAAIGFASFGPQSSQNGQKPPNYIYNFK
jgi:hypothetical protein